MVLTWRPSHGRAIRVAPNLRAAPSEGSYGLSGPSPGGPCGAGGGARDTGRASGRPARARGNDKGRVKAPGECWRGPAGPRWGGISGRPPIAAWSVCACGCSAALNAAAAFNQLRVGSLGGLWRRRRRRRCFSPLLVVLSHPSSPSRDERQLVAWLPTCPPRRSRGSAPSRSRADAPQCRHTAP
eukprot:scaffold3166_cov399-Prasinococcus_capsulatus_cf.AAC.20